MIRPALVAALLINLSMSAAGQERSAATPTVVRDSVLALPGGTEYVPGPRQLRYHGTLTSPAGATFFVLSGFECDDCDALRSVHILRPSERLNLQNERQPGFAYPGTVHDADGMRVSWSRLFVGRCSEDASVIAVQVASVLNSHGRWENGSVLVRSTADALRITVGPYVATLTEVALQRVRTGQCQEIPADNRQISV